MRDTIDMAEEAGAISYWHLSKLKAFEALVRADEREACAKVCEDDASTPEERICAAAIRARGNT
jgi:hypothetical protein